MCDQTVNNGQTTAPMIEAERRYNDGYAQYFAASAQKVTIYRNTTLILSIESLFQPPTSSIEFNLVYVHDSTVAIFKTHAKDIAA